MEVYTWRAFCGREISPNVLEGPRPDMHPWIVQNDNVILFSPHVPHITNV